MRGLGLQRRKKERFHQKKKRRKKERVMDLWEEDTEKKNHLSILNWVVAPAVKAYDGTVYNAALIRKSFEFFLLC